VGCGVSCDDEKNINRVSRGKGASRLIPSIANSIVKDDNFFKPLLACNLIYPLDVEKLRICSDRCKLKCLGVIRKFESQRTDEVGSKRNASDNNIKISTKKRCSVFNPSSEVIWPFHTFASSSHMKCAVCGELFNSNDDNGRTRVITDLQLSQSWKNGHYIKKYSRIHERHIDKVTGMLEVGTRYIGSCVVGGGLKLSLSDLVEVERIWNDHINKYIATRDGKMIVYDELDESDCMILTGWSLQQLHSIVESVVKVNKTKKIFRESDNRTISEAVLMWCIKIRTNWSYEMIGFHFKKIDRQVVRRCFDDIMELLQHATIVNENIGVDDDNTDSLLTELSKEHTGFTRAFFDPDFSDKIILLIWDATYLYKFKPGSIHEMQKNNFSKQKGRHLTKHMTVATPTGKIVETLGPFSARLNDAMIAKIIGKHTFAQACSNSNISNNQKGDATDNDDDFFQWIHINNGEKGMYSNE